MVTRTRPITDIGWLHPGQVPLHKTLNQRPYVTSGIGSSKIDVYADLGKPLHRSRSQAANHDCLNLCVVEDLHGHHTSSRLMFMIDNSFYMLNVVIRAKTHHSKNITMAEMI